MIFVVYSCGRKRHVDAGGLADYVASVLARSSEASVRVTACVDSPKAAVLAELDR